MTVNTNNISLKIISRLGFNPGSNKRGLIVPKHSRNLKPVYPERISGLLSSLSQIEDNGNKELLSVNDWNTNTKRFISNTSLLGYAYAYGYISSLPLTHSGLERGNMDVSNFSSSERRSQPVSEFRVKDEYRKQLIQTKSLKRIYGIKSKSLRRKFSTSLKGLKKAIRAYCVHGYQDQNILSPLERSLSVVLNQSGLVLSLNMARQLVLRGKVIVRFPGEKEFYCKYPFRSRLPGTIVRIQPEIYCSLLKSKVNMVSNRISSQQRIKGGLKHKSDGLGVQLHPSYLKVDWKLGSVVFRKIPSDSDVPISYFANLSLNFIK
jgi:ribosomal protein S4